MCGIHFILDKKRLIKDDRAIQAMVDRSELRGPDFSDFKRIDFGEAQVFLGANKLSITDFTDGSNQPFQTEENSMILVYNGEIYSYQDLKNEQLKEGYQFKSNSDTEVLYNHLKSSLDINQLHGMFSFILVDPENHRITIARDRWGMKPLFYFENENYKIVSSQIQSILATDLLRKELNPTVIAEYLQYKYAIRPNTFFKNVYEWEPGKVETETAGIKKTDSLGATNTLVGVHNNSEFISQQLDMAILRHLPPAGLPGLFLSGGVDSTLILASLNHLGITGIPSYSFVSGAEDKKYGTEDYRYARMAAKQYESVHHEVETDFSQFERIDEFISALDQPVADSAEFMTWILAEEGVKSSRVFLHGAGADELFLGYNRHLAFEKYLKFRRLILDIKTPVPDKMRFLPARIRKLLWSLDTDPGKTWNRMISFPDFFSSETISGWDPAANSLDQAITHDRNNYLSSDVLAITDRASMRNGMEVRLPYLDNEFVTTVESIRNQELISKGPKWMLKEILIKRGGKRFANRTKEGFGLPFQSWVFKDLENINNQLLGEDKILHEFVAKRKIKYLFAQQGKGVNKSLELWALLVLAKWLDRNF